MDERELNKKLAEWAGWKEVDFPLIFNLETPIIRGIVQGQPMRAEFFTQSLDACFNWLVPKGIEKLMSCGFSSMTAYTILLDRMRDLIIWKGNAPALALCLAISKIDRGEDEK